MGTIRIIAGKWRSRKITVPDGVRGLRPTPNMARETLFNWLAPVIKGAACLDLFAGSGALSFEALSRGAKHVVMVDCSRQVIKQLQTNLHKLQGQAEHVTATKNQGAHVTMACACIPQQLTHVADLALSSSISTFDIVFLDPPFHHNLLQPTAAALEEISILAMHALIYIETERQLDIAPLLPSNWTILRHKSLGAVSYYLITRNR